MIEEREYGLDHPGVALTVMNLGAAYDSLGDPAKARDITSAHSEINERAYGRDHPQVAASLHRPGEAVLSLGEPMKALGLQERSLSIRERAFGRDHTENRYTLIDLGKRWHALGDATKARELIGEAPAIFERAFGPDHSETVKCKGALAEHLDSAGGDVVGGLVPDVRDGAHAVAATIRHTSESDAGDSGAPCPPSPLGRLVDVLRRGRARPAP